MTFFMHEMMSPGTETQDEPQAFFCLRLIFFEPCPRARGQEPGTTPLVGPLARGFY